MGYFVWVWRLEGGLAAHHLALLVINLGHLGGASKEHPEPRLRDCLCRLSKVSAPPRVRFGQKVVHEPDPYVLAHLVQLLVHLFWRLQIQQQVPNQSAVCERKKLRVLPTEHERVSVRDWNWDERNRTRGRRAREAGGEVSGLRRSGFKLTMRSPPPGDAPFAFEDILSLSSRSPRSPVPSDWGAAFPSDFAFWRRIAALTVFRERRSFYKRLRNFEKSERLSRNTVKVCQA